jgi:hypothetical protein
MALIFTKPIFSIAVGGDCRSFEPLIPEFAGALLHPDPHLGKLERLARESA